MYLVTVGGERSEAGENFARRDSLRERAQTFACLAYATRFRGPFRAFTSKSEKDEILHTTDHRGAIILCRIASSGVADMCGSNHPLRDL